MSETCGVGTCNRPGAVKIGTVGPAGPDSEVRIAADGEVLWRGPSLMSGYRGDPAKTAEAIDPEGWLHTGDVGRLDEDGFLTIVDRKSPLGRTQTSSGAKAPRSPRPDHGRPGLLSSP